MFYFKDYSLQTSKPFYLLGASHGTSQSFFVGSTASLKNLNKIADYSHYVGILGNMIGGFSCVSRKFSILNSTFVKVDDSI